MKLKNEIEINDFLSAVDRAKHPVFLVSVEGDRYNLKSTLSRYVAIAELIKDYGTELELFCDDKNDEQYFFGFFLSHPEVLN
jgi:c-di-GMP-related signal transduction protein